jgi:hypothetical protein
LARPTTVLDRGEAPNAAEIELRRGRLPNIQGKKKKKKELRKAVMSDKKT